MRIIAEQDGVQSFIAEEDGKLIHGTLQDAHVIREEAKELHNLGYHGSSDMKVAARLPFVAVETYMNLRGIDLAEFLSNPVHARNMCNDPALKDFRIWPGQL